MVRAGVALDLRLHAAGARGELLAGRRRRPVVGLAEEQQQPRLRLVAAPQVGHAAGIEGHCERRLRRRLGHVLVPQVGRGEHRAAAVGPTHQAEARGIDLRLGGQPVERGQRVDAAVRLRDQARAGLLGADLPLAARRQRIEHQLAVATLSLGGVYWLVRDQDRRERD